MDVAQAEAAAIGGDIERAMAVMDLGDLDESRVERSLPPRDLLTFQGEECDVARVAFHAGSALSDASTNG